MMIFNVDSNRVHPRFWIRPLMGDIRHNVVNILRFLRKSTSWHQVLWSLVVSDLIPGDSWYLRKSPYVSWFIFKIIDVWWFIVRFWCYHFTNMYIFTPNEEWCEALSSRGQVSEIRGSSSKWGRDPFSPSFILSNRIQMNNSRHRPWWFST